MRALLAHLHPSTATSRTLTPLRRGTSAQGQICFKISPKSWKHVSRFDNVAQSSQCQNVDAHIILAGQIVGHRFPGTGLVPTEVDRVKRLVGCVKYH